MDVQSSTLARSWAVQRRVIGALLLRELLTRYGRHNIGFLWLFVEPILFTSAITALWSAFRNLHGSDLPIVAFALTGYSTVLLWRNMPSRCINALTPNLSLMYHRNVRILDIYAARLLLEVCGATISFIVLSLVFMFFGLVDPPVDVLKVAGAWFLFAWFGCALGLLLGGLSERYALVEKIWSPMSYMAFPLSGAAFMVDVFPKHVQEILLLIPMVNGVEMLRDGYFGSVVRTHYDAGYFALWCTMLTLVGLANVRIVGRKVTPE